MGKEISEAGCVCVKTLNGDECNETAWAVSPPADVTILKKVIEMLRSRRGQETEKQALEAKVKMQ